MAQHQPKGRASESGTREIPDKLYFRIGEVSTLCALPAHVLRFWESEFPQLKPHKGGTGQRLYRRGDVEMALRIKRLLYDEGYTIPGARQALKSEQKQGAPLLALGLQRLTPPAQHVVDPKKLKRLRRDLEELRALLARPSLGAAPPAPTAQRPSDEPLLFPKLPEAKLPEA